MKQIRTFLILTIFLSLSALYSCSDWLDIEPKDKVLEDKQYSSELRTNSVLNGIYRSLSNQDLYGASLSQTYTEYLAHYYDFLETQALFTSDLEEWSEVARFNYQTKNVKGKTAKIWENAYNSIYSINTFIENVSTSNSVREDRKKILLGEAYALRAFLHYDMFRLFGPVYILNPQAKAIPYNATTQVINHSNEIASDFLDLVLKDLSAAEELLQNDPILTTGVNDKHGEITKNSSITVEDRFAEYYRNRKMNYYATKALRARVLLQKGSYTEATNLASEILDQAVGDNKPFYWNTKKEDVDKYSNYIFYNEVLFGITNPNLHTNWTTFFNGLKPGSTHVVVQSNLYNNIFGEFSGTEITKITDIRGSQWQLSEINGQTGTGTGNKYISKKYRQHDIDWVLDVKAPYLDNFQPLIRISELYYIQAEAAIANKNASLAAEKINFVMGKRGVQNEQMLDPATATIEEVQIRLEREYYREFMGEGQAFFYVKRIAQQKIFKGYNAGHDTIDEADLNSVYVVPLPDSETIIE